MLGLTHRTPDRTATLPFGPNAPNALDLFSGIGGFSLGATAAGCNVVGAVEHDPVTAYSYHANLAERRTLRLTRKVEHIDTASLPNVDIITAGPPCQPWSSASGGSDKSDKRRELLYTPVEWAQELDPSVVLIENVPNLKTQYREALNRLKREFADTGYTVATQLIKASNYHVPQHRERLFILAVDEALVSSFDSWFPEPTTSAEGQLTLNGSGNDLPKYVTAEEVLGDLPDPILSQPPADDPIHETIADQPFLSVETNGEHRIDPHSTPSELRRSGGTVTVPPNHIAADHHDQTRHKHCEMPLGYLNDDGEGSTTDRRLPRSEPACTMTCSNGTPPFHYQGNAPTAPDEPVADVRRLTPREVARIQTFPDTIVAGGTRKEQFKQFANAVPPLLTFQLCNHIRTEILSTDAGLHTTEKGNPVSMTAERTGDA